jgi:uncharacterized membrane protein
VDQARREKYERGHDPARVLALSDGVFAIILTLLVLEVHVPDLGQGESLKDAMRQVRPSFVAFLISFVVVAISWAGHRDLFALIRRTDRTLVWLNILYLLPLSILPFGASLLARYDRDPVALRIYGMLLVTIAATRLGIWVYATARTHLLIAPLDARSRWAAFAIAAAPGIIYGFAILIAESDPTASLVIYAAVPILYFIAISVVRSSAPPESAERDFT